MRARPLDLPVLALSGLLSLPAFVQAGPVADQFNLWRSEPSVSRRISLADLGITKPLILSADTTRELYLPVPASVSVQNAALQFNANYLRGNGGRSSLLLSADGDPLLSNRLLDDRGDLTQRLAVSGAPRSNGFLRVELAWSSILSDLECADQRAPGNVLRVAPDSTLSYNFDPRQVRDLATAWTALPLTPTLLVSQDKLQSPAFDTAWRLGLALEQSGKRVKIRALPAIGDTLDLGNLVVPERLLAVPAFAALAKHGEPYRLGNDAELAALLALGNAGPLAADVVVRDDALVSRIKAAFDALGQQVQTVAPDAAGPYAAWREQAVPLAQGASIRLASLGSNLAIVVEQGSGAQAAGLFATQWRNLAVGKALNVRAASEPVADEAMVLLNRFGTLAGTMDVFGRSDRSVLFDLGVVAGNNRLPVEVGINVTAAPNVAGEAPVASIFLNDFLIGSAKLNPDGKPQWIRAEIPRHVLAARNELKVSFLRQPTQLRCHDQPISFPVSILPGSYLRLDKGKPAADFVGVTAGFGTRQQIAVPATWLEAAPVRLQQMIRVAGAAGMSAQQAQFQAVPTGQKPTFSAPFLAMDVAVDGADLTSVKEGHLIINGKHQSPVLDVATLDHLAVAEVAKVGDNLGIVYRTIGQHPPQPEQSFRLTRGDVAAIGDAGLILQIDSRAAAESGAAQTQAWWQRWMAPGPIAIGVAGLLVLLVILRRLFRRKPKH
ncbi:cellulose biosynthesis cyclic di-GMP-binding regulatory protein BcsB [Jeongeupia naejangsanensis]|uniref:Cellulose biosynthesis cyclic di-GMP-binding regulatory protein BcsB n=1 Tax=Jeongeupia naejangsanensis TaxID=613195 RepID=A0ABS2BQ95_9NEIS|nr:cellulose biosynthesis cyclic di-GMP-binding regulatory protein BcsB [Jeongeupia naejangsanensis]MBM3117802.1 cellulose biosynthesis cyclic di-GMP-binding regulatory protein BcsB [Jeongeupia naejangsanensis]